MNKLQNAREQIDSIDAEMSKLFCRRMKAARDARRRELRERRRALPAATRIAAEDRDLAARAKAEGLDCFSEPIERTASALASRIVDAARAELEGKAFTLSEAEEILAKLANINVMALLDAIKRF